MTTGMEIAKNAVRVLINDRRTEVEKAYAQGLLDACIELDK